MSLPYEEIDYRPTVMGDLILRRRKIAMLDGLEVFGGEARRRAF
jgi:hypothetical protein